MRLKIRALLLMILSLSVFVMSGCKDDSVDVKDNTNQNEEAADETSVGDEEYLTAGLDDAHTITDEHETVTVENGEITAGSDIASADTESTYGQTDGSIINGSSSNVSNDNAIKNTTIAENSQTTAFKYSVALNQFNIDTGVSVHDPSIIKANGKYYIFGSQLSQAATLSLSGRWTSLGTQGDSNRLLYGADLLTSLAEPHQWAGKKGDTTDSEESQRVWAPDVIYNASYVWQDGSKGAYMLYSCTTSTAVRSCIIYSVSKNVEGPYTYVDTIIYSGFSKNDAYDSGSTVNKNVSNTNVLDVLGGTANLRASYFNKDGSYNSYNFPNAIDPNVFFDGSGQLWMTYGSWSGGIWITKLDSSTGQPVHDYATSSSNGLTDKYFGKQIAAGGGASCEAPYVLYDRTSGYYYLFVSYGGLSSTGGYNIRLFRSKSPDGTYVDSAGGDARQTNNVAYGVKFMGGYDFPSLKNGYLSPGHNSAFIDDDGKKYVVYHTRFETLGEWHQPRVHQMFTNEQGWLCAAPFATKGETISATGYTKDEMAGTYYVVLQTATNNTTCAKYQEVKLNSNGTVSGAYIGSWTYTSGKYYMQIKIAGIQYYGVFLKMNDEAGNNCITFSAVGTNNQTLWGVKYLN